LNSDFDSVVYASIFGGKENATDYNSAGYLALYTTPNGSTPTEKMRITSTGNVGIGTASPDVLYGFGAGHKIIDVLGNPSTNISSILILGNIAPSINGELGWIVFGNGASGYHTGIYGFKDGSSAATGMQLYTYNTAGVFVNAMRITSAGNVGIGTTSPSMSLTIKGDKQGDANEGQGQLLIDGNSAYNASNGSTLSASGAGSVIIFRGKWNTAESFTGFAGISGSKENTTNGDYGGNIRFYTRTNGANDPGERMRITSTGNVGIGTACPLFTKLAVNGDIGLGVYGTPNTSFKIGPQRPDGTGFVNMPYINFKIDGNTNGLITFSTVHSGVAGYTDAMVINYDGKVGIGRTPTTNILEINGNASKTTAGDWLSNSDSTIKTEIHTIDGALDRINKVRLVSFKYKDEYKLLNPSIKDKFYQNVIAQEYQEIYPDYVYQSGDIFEDKNILQVDTNPMYIDGIASIQELSILLQEQQCEIKQLKLCLGIN
jgi:hypothetical protein